MGDASIKGRSPLLKGGRVGFSRAGPVGNLPWVRGTSRPGVKKAPRGAEHKEAIKQEREWKLKHEIKKTKKMPDKEFKHVNLETKQIKSDRTGKMVTVPKTELVKGSKGKKNYIQMMKYYHHRAQPKGKK